jgi:hypothetical protein
MDTNPDRAAGTPGAPLPSNHSVHGLSVGGHDLRQLLVYQVMIKSGLTEPFRILFKPLKPWMLARHVSIHPEEGASETVELPLRKPGAATLVLSILLAPLVFLMLMPLLLILAPLALGVAFIAVLAACLQSDEPTMLSADSPAPAHSH